jgi:hypothetical protein
METVRLRSTVRLTVIGTALSTTLPIFFRHFSANAKDARMTRHIDVRGLLFCPERRNACSSIVTTNLLAPSPASDASGSPDWVALPLRRKKRTKLPTTRFVGSPMISEEEGGCNQTKSQPTDGAACTHPMAKRYLLPHLYRG